MRFICVQLKQNFKDVALLAVDVYTTGNRAGVRRTVVLLLLCSSFSLLLSSLLLLYLLFALGYEPAASGGIAGCFGTLLAVALFLSKRARCVGILFFMSIFMKHSRNLLLTAGTSLVVLVNIRNTLENLTGLVRSVVCNLKAKRDAIVTPLDKYVKMLTWIGDVLKGFPDLDVVKFYSELKVSFHVESGEFKEKLVEAERHLNETAKYAQSVVRAVTSAADRMFPAVSFLLLMTFIALHVRKYRSRVKYQNRFISSRFVCFDEKRKAEGRSHVLPLTPEEAKRYGNIPSARPTARERKALLKFSVPIFTHVVSWVVFIGVDALSYCFVDTVTTRLSELEPFNIPLIMNITHIPLFIGIRTWENKEQRDFSYSVTLFEKQCLPQPQLLLYNSLAPLGAILTALLIMATVAAKLTQLRLMVCERFFSSAAEERVEHLHATILRKRTKGRRANADERSLRSIVFKVCMAAYY
ncbi:dendritic cell-specific transmembrane protein [Diretmus argenteus]